MKAEPNSYSEYLDHLETEEEQWIDEFDKERYDEPNITNEKEKNLPF